MPHTHAWNDGQTTVKKMLGLRGITSHKSGQSRILMIR